MPTDSADVKRSDALEPKIRSLLIKGSSGTNRDLLPTDPLSPTPMNLEIDRIKPYDRNPRREVHPRYDEIQASIRAQRGLNNPLTVTRRPGDERFMIQAGGNTRLKILKELCAETQDKAFYRVNVLFVPWVSEAQVLSAHLIENELRGDMVLIDKAFAVKDLKVQFEREVGEPLNAQRVSTQAGNERIQTVETPVDSIRLRH